MRAKKVNDLRTHTCTYRTRAYKKKRRQFAHFIKEVGIFGPQREKKVEREREQVGERIRGRLRDGDRQTKEKMRH